MIGQGASLELLGIGLVLMILAAIFWILARLQRSRLGIPAGDIIYSDLGTWEEQLDALYSAELRLVGRPDYLIREPSGSVIPVEIKSTFAPQRPREGHILQLAAYCLLVDDIYGYRPGYGILQYRDKAFAVDYSDDLEADLLDLLSDMQNDAALGKNDRDHNELQLCIRCGLRNNCDQRLA
jgi:CRISPR-associated exonuclease Cas4